ncbi:hypothetical protein MAE02_57640 [Microvirga aerophila]|uniref:Helix-turn-helix domain-containing protein n=1 Tax=Microvirga aerophila TaxID=670291 RepID=A0A512C1I0_9HYPH|nr:hypothetical protein MAE02_57640 [Microvirga aerophila]
MSLVVTALLPRCLSRADAALYCGLTPEGFDAWVRRGIVPSPISGTQRWDRKAIDVALDRASGLESAQDEDDPFERWRAAHARTS